ncbi:MAG: hypothetical protein Q7U51_14205, partial [Methanoregula sp.]|nr:hypothetical protein [Methanoregula sp.]
CIIEIMKEKNTASDNFKYVMPFIYGVLAFVAVYLIYPVPIFCVVIGGGVVFWQWDKISENEELVDESPTKK